MNRRYFLQSLVALSFPLSGCTTFATKKVALPDGEWVNDVHSQLNPTWVQNVVRVHGADEVQALVQQARQKGVTLSVCGTRHAMGGQQFGTNSILLDTADLDHVLSFDRVRGFVTVESGIDWPKLINFLIKAQAGDAQQWAIAQKQTGADHLTIGGAVAANIHGRGLQMMPFVNDVEAIQLVTADGEIIECSRRKNNELFRLVVGGYGLFGFVYSVTIRLVPRQKLERVVLLAAVNEIPALLEKRITDGYLYGDFQYAINERNSDFLQRGICACYRPVPAETQIPNEQRELSNEEWKKLIEYAHTDKNRAFQIYTEHYLASNGQIYWSDLNQMGPYFLNYHRELDQQWRAGSPATEIISELYVPHQELPSFMEDAAKLLRSRHDDVIYGTVRFIKRDHDTFLAWAKRDYACVIFNLHTVHSPENVVHIAETFRMLIDCALRRQGSYYLTYHRFAHRDQVLSCYPEFSEFLRLKREIDPEEVWDSDWYRYYRQLFTTV